MIGILAIAWWRSATDLRGHAQAGAELIVAALARQMAPSEQEAPGESSAHEPPALADVHQLLPGLGEPVALRIAATDHAAGRTLAALDLRSRTGAVVLAITRGGDRILLPTGHETLRAEDVLAVVGTRDAVEAARSVLRVDRDAK